MITSYFPGRIRLRSPIFKDKEISLLLKNILEKHEAIKKITHNHVTGSVLLEYNESNLPLEKLKALKEDLLKLKDIAWFYSEKDKEKIIALIEKLGKNLLIK